MIHRHRERQQRSALLTGHSLTADIQCEAARFADHLLRAGERFHVRAATAAVTLLAFMRLDFIIFGIQAVEFQELFPVRGGEVGEPGLAEGRIFHAQGNFRRGVIGV